MSKKIKYRIGIDMGGTKTLVVLLDNRFDVVAEDKIKTRPERGRAALLKSLLESIKSILKESGVKTRSVECIGIGCPGIVDHVSGRIINVPNIPALSNYTLADQMTSALGRPVYVENDVNAGLFGEFAFGSARGYNHALGVFMGTGIGGAMVFDGRLFRGAGGGAGEIGHMVLDPTGPLCGCGKTGCFETFASRLAIASEAAVLASRQQAPLLFKMTGTDLSDIKSNALARALKKGDLGLKHLFERKAALIGVAVGNAVNLLNPDIVVLGGGLIQALPRSFVAQVSEAIKLNALPFNAKKLKVAPAMLGDYATAKGAARLASDRKYRRGQA